MAYAERLLLWGGSNPSFSSFEDFTKKFLKRNSESLGLLELLSIEMKMSGSFIARSLSWEGSEFDIETLALTPEQVEVHKACCDFFTDLKREIVEALKEHGEVRGEGAAAMVGEEGGGGGGGNRKRKAAATMTAATKGEGGDEKNEDPSGGGGGAGSGSKEGKEKETHTHPMKSFWSMQQRFFGQLLNSFKVGHLHTHTHTHTSPVTYLLTHTYIYTHTHTRWTRSWQRQRPGSPRTTVW